MRLHQRKTVAAVGLSSILAIAGSVPVAAFVVGFPDALWRFSIRATAGKHLGMEDVALQDKPNNCGPAVIKMLFDHYKIPSTLAEIEKRVGLTEKGTSMLSLKETAESVGLRAQGWRYSLENLQRAPMPVIVFVHKDHFALVDSVTMRTWR